MSERTENLKLIISGDGRQLGAELSSQEQKIRTWGGRVGGIFAGVGKKVGSVVKNIATNPLAIVGGTAGLIHAGKQIIDYKDKLSTLGINAEKTSAEILALDEKVTDLAYATGQSRDSLVEAINDITDKTGDFDFVMAAMENVGRASTGMGADVMDSGRVLSSLKLGFGATAEEAEEYFDIMARMGSVGSFTFAEQATQAERLFSAGALAIGLQKKNFAEYNAFMQAVKPMFGSADMAGTAIESIMIRLKTSGSKIEKKLGFKLFDEKGAIIDFKKTMKSIAKLSPGKRKELFGEYSKAFTVFDTKKGLESFDMLIEKGQQAGFITEAFTKKQQEAKFQVNTLGTALQEMAGAGLVPILDELTIKFRELTENPEAMENFRESIRGVASSIGELTSAIINMAPAFELLGVAADMFGVSTRSKLTKEAAQELKTLSKEDRKKVRSLVKGNDWDSGLYMVLQKFKAEKNQNFEAKTNVIVNVHENGRTVATTQAVGGTAKTEVNDNRGSF